MKIYLASSQEPPKDLICFPKEAQQETTYNHKRYKLIGSTEIHHGLDGWRFKKILKSLKLSLRYLFSPQKESSLRESLVRNFKKGISGQQQQFIYQEISQGPAHLPSSTVTKLEKTSPPKETSCTCFVELQRKVKNEKISESVESVIANYLDLSSTIDLAQVPIGELKAFLDLFSLLKDHLPKDKLQGLHITKEQVRDLFQQKTFDRSLILAFAQFNDRKDDLMFAYHANLCTPDYCLTEWNAQPFTNNLLKLAQGREEEADFLEFLFNKHNDKFRIPITVIASEKLAHKLLALAFKKNSFHKQTYFVALFQNKLDWILNLSDEVLASYLELCNKTQIHSMLQQVGDKNRLESLLVLVKSEKLPSFTAFLTQPILIKRGIQNLSQDLDDFLKQGEETKVLPQFLSLLDKSSLFQILPSKKGEKLALCFPFLSNEDQENLLDLLCKQEDAEKRISELLLNLIPRLHSNYFYWERQFRERWISIHLVWEKLNNQTEIRLEPFYLSFIQCLSKSIHHVLFEKEHQKELNAYLNDLSQLIPLQTLKNCLNQVRGKSHLEPLEILEILPLLQNNSMNEGTFEKIFSQVDKKYLGYAFQQASLFNKARIFKQLDSTSSNDEKLLTIRLYLGDQDYLFFREEAKKSNQKDKSHLPLEYNH